MMLGECGENCALYVHECVGSVSMLFGMFGFHIRIEPSHELERNVSLDTRFQCTANTSLPCSCHDCMGNWSSDISNNFMLPSPEAVSTWFSCASDHAKSKSESCVSNLNHVRIVELQIYSCSQSYHFSVTMPLAVKPKMYSLPLPTNPKFADPATAILESKNGEYLTAYPW